jgi:hypothetical protein
VEQEHPLEEPVAAGPRLLVERVAPGEVLEEPCRDPASIVLLPDPYADRRNVLHEPRSIRHHSSFVKQWAGNVHVPDCSPRPHDRLDGRLLIPGRR